MGSLVLPDDLAVGSYRSLTQEELKGLAAHFAEKEGENEV